MPSSTGKTSLPRYLEAKLNTPVLFLVFNRPEPTREVFEAIRTAKPTKLYIASDGPRGSRNGEDRLVTIVREIVSHVDWPCTVQTRFLEENIGCKHAVSSAIDWFFECEKKGIILEDDCLPNQSFFYFCQELLNKYENDYRVGQICGFNPLSRFNENDSTYLFSRFGPIWGWATWRSRWAEYDVGMGKWAELRGTIWNNMVGLTPGEIDWRNQMFDRVSRGLIDTWDYQWSFAKIINNQVSVLPTKNLVRNIGFNADATHTKKDLESAHLAYEIDHIIHPPCMMRDSGFDRNYLAKFVGLNRRYTLLAHIKTLFQEVISIFQRLKHGLRNRIIDNATSVPTFTQLLQVEKSISNASKSDVKNWLSTGGLDQFVSSSIHKKGLEFYFSSLLLGVESQHSILDAAGGASSYLKAIRLNSGAKDLYLTDQIYDGVRLTDEGVHIVGGDIATIQLDNESIDKIACHHAFEHFQHDKDIEFISEAYRLLSPKGVLVIIPIFVANDYIECWNIATELHFDPQSTVLIDQSSTLPGGDPDGHFARIYSPKSLVERILSHAKALGFNCEIIECRVDGEAIPDMHRNIGSKLNRPLRALRLQK